MILGKRASAMRLALGVLLVLLLSAPASAQYTLDAKGRRYRCVVYDWTCTVLPPPAWPISPLRDRQHVPPPPFLGARPPVPYVPPPLPR